jgi:hypothetical protein
MNVVVGTYAFDANTTGSFNTAVGRAALSANTTANNNTAIGYQALDLNTTGANNVAIGSITLDANTTTSDNTSVGYASLSTQNGGNGRNTAFGSQALGNLTTGDSNVAIGYFAGVNTTTGTGNVFVGGGQFGVSNPAGTAVTTGNKNTFVGNSAGNAVTTGSSNVIVGSYTGNSGGLDIRTSSNNIVLSDGDGNAFGIFNSQGNFLINKKSSTIGDLGQELRANGETFHTIASPNNTLHVYSSTASAYRFYVSHAGQINATSTSISAISDERLKENIVDLETGLSEVMALQPRRFDWKNGDGENVAGFIAQEVETVLPDLIGNFIHSEIDDAKSLKMGDMLPTLVKAIQEQQTIIDDLKSRIETLEG